MDLLNELAYDFRYALYHTKDSRIIVLFYKSNEVLTNETQTPIETLYENTILKRYDIEESETIKTTCNENPKTNDLMNLEIVNYCKKYSKSKEIRFINVTINHKILFESKVYKAMVENTEELYLDLGESGVRIDDTDYNTLNKLSIQSGILYPETSSFIYVRELFVMNCEITVANKNEEDDHNFNIIVSKKANIINMKLYSTIGFVITAGSKEGLNISSALFMTNCIRIYGSEKQNDLKECVGIYGFKTVLIGELVIEDEVTCGNIIKADKIVSFTINSINRNIVKLDEGNCIILHRIGNVSLTKINYNINEDSILPSNASIIKFLKDTDSGMHKKINVFDSSISNPTSTPINLVYLEETEVENIYVSDCTILDGVNFINKVEEASILKLVYNNVTMDINSNDIIFNNIKKLYLTNSNITTTKNILIESPHVIINGGMWEFDKCNIGNNEFITNKVNTKEIEMIGKEFNIISDTKNSFDGQFFDNDSKFKIDDIYIKGFQSSFASTVFMTKSLQTFSDKLTTINRAIFFMENDNVNITANSSLTGKIVFSTENTGLEANIKIKDSIKFLQNNTIDIISSSETPEIFVTTNNTVRLKMVNHTSDHMYLNYTSDYDSEQNSKVIYETIYTTPMNYKVITNSEKLLSIHKLEKLEDGNVVFEAIKK